MAMLADQGRGPDVLGAEGAGDLGRALLSLLALGTRFGRAVAAGFFPAAFFGLAVRLVAGARVFRTGLRRTWVALLVVVADGRPRIGARRCKRTRCRIETLRRYKDKVTW